MSMSQLDPGHVIKSVYDEINLALRVNVVAGSFSISINSEKVDNTTFTPGVSSTLSVGSVVDEVAPLGVTEGNLGATRMSPNRSLYTQIRDAAGNERGVNVTASNALTVDGSATTQPVSDGGGSLTVDAVNLDIRDLTSVSDSVSAIVTSSALPTGAATSANQTNKTQYTHLTDGTDDALITGAGELNVLATAQPGIDIGDVTINNAAGAASVNIQDGGNSITVDGAVAATQSGAWNITNITGTVSLPTGAATSANQTNKAQFTHITDGVDDVLVTGAGEMNVLATAQPGVDIGDVTVNNAAGASAVNIQDGGNSITVDGTIAISGGTITVTATDLDIRDLSSATDSISAVITSSALPTGAATSANQTNKAQYTHITDGTDDALVTATGELNVLATAQPGVDIGDVTINNAAGASAVNIQDGGNSLTIDGSLTNISGTISLPTGASTSANQTNKTQYTHITDGTDDALVTGAGELNVLATAQPGVDIGDVTINNASGGAAVNIQDGGNSITVDGSLTTTEAGYSTSGFVRNDYTSVNVTTAAYVTLIASTATTYQEFEIFDSSGQTLKIAFGAAASEVDQFLVFPGGNGRIKKSVGSGVRISIKAVSATASVGEIDLNLYG